MDTQFASLVILTRPKFEILVKFFVYSRWPISVQLFKHANRLCTYYWLSVQYNPLKTMFAFWNTFQYSAHIALFEQLDCCFYQLFHFSWNTKGGCTRWFLWMRSSWRVCTRGRILGGFWIMLLMDRWRKLPKCAQRVWTRISIAMILEVCFNFIFSFSNSYLL